MTERSCEGIDTREWKWTYWGRAKLSSILKSLASPEVDKARGEESKAVLRRLQLTNELFLVDDEGREMTRG
jgi:hypothetical protein